MRLMTLGESVGSLSCLAVPMSCMHLMIVTRSWPLGVALLCQVFVRETVDEPQSGAL